MATVTFETKHVHTITVNTRYLDQFFKLHAAPNLVALFPNPKEVTESFGALEGIRHLQKMELCPSMHDPEVTVIVPGDGHVPRTGALITHLSNWEVISIDPVIRCEGRGETIYKGILHKNLSCYKAKIQDLPKTKTKKTAIILAVHSHALLQDCVDKLDGYENLCIVTIDCCVPQHFKYSGKEVRPVKEYRDIAIWSPKNEIKLWHLSSPCSLGLGSASGEDDTRESTGCYGR